jgi:hypothetical protein
MWVKVTEKAVALVIMLFACNAMSIAQSGKISGRVFSSSKEPVSNATVRLVTADSSHKFSLLTDSSGYFSFNNITPGNYFLSITALSFDANKRNIKLSRNRNNIQLDSLFLQPSYNALEGVTVVAKKATATVKNDTIAFNAGSFRVRKNGTAEDLFKKIPGMEVDKNTGAVKAQGEAITQIYVDGKPFFGTDIKSVTQNFPADVIDKIEIIDKKSDQALATKVEDGVREKIINITLKKNRKRGLFGKDYIAGGTDNRYEIGSSTNMFNNARKIAIVAGANNTGRNDNNNSGSNDASYNTGNGLNNKQSLKINYADKIGSDFDFSSWAGYEHNKTTRIQSINRQNIYTDSSSYYAENNNSTNNSQNMYAGLYFEYRPDTLTWVRFNENANYYNSHNISSSLFNSTLNDGYKLNNGERANSSVYKNPSLSGQASFNHRFGSSRRSIFFNINNNINSTPTELYNHSSNYFYPQNATSDSLLVNQYQNNNTRNSYLGTSVSYSEPMSKNSSLNLGYSYNYGTNNIARNVYNYDAQTLLYDQYSDSLSSHYNNNNYNTAASLSYNYGNKNIGLGTRVRWLTSYVQSQPLGKDSSYNKSFTGFAPNINFYSNGKNKHFNIYYNYSLQAPQAYQLQPVIDNTNPLYLRLGNPNLKYASVHLIKYNYNYFNPKTETGFNSNASFSSIVNNFATSNINNIITGSQVSQPINIDGAYNWNAWFSYFSPIHFGKDKIKWNINLYANGSKNINLLNGEQNVAQNNYAKVYVGLTYDSPKWIDLHTDFSISRQSTDYSLQPNLSNTSYFVNVSPNITLIPVSNTEINIDYDYRQTSGQAAGYNTSINMLNADVVQYFSEKKDVWIKLKAYDILNQNVNVWRSVGDNYIQDTRANVLSRFVLLSLNFRLNKFGTNKKQDPLEFPEATNSSSSSL